MRLFVVTGQLGLYQQIKMNPAIQKFLENLSSNGEEEKKKIIEEIQKLEMEKTSERIKREAGSKRRQ